ncbi:MAG: hypothetical protein HFG29_00740 [Eubacterium sp.]|nr:hypothetical protein [Eubacterium sp.]
MKTLKKISAVVAALALTAGMCINVFAATAGWTDYLGFDGKKGHTWYEAADGKVTNITESGWQADLKQIGWGGIWGAQMYRKIDVVKGKKYHITCKLKSSDCNKWVFIKISTKEDFAFGKWVWLTKGTETTVDEVFTAEANADQITFGFGGEYGDREATDGNKHYAYAGGAKAIAAKKDADGDSGPHDKTFTTITCSGYSLTEDGAQPAGGTTTAATGTASTTTTTVATGDFTPIACGAAAIIAAAAIVVFARKREND